MLTREERWLPAVAVVLVVLVEGPRARLQLLQLAREQRRKIHFAVLLPKVLIGP